MKSFFFFTYNIRNIPFNIQFCISIILPDFLSKNVVLPNPAKLFICAKI